MSNTVTVTEQNNTVSILEDAPVVTVDPWYAELKTIPTSSGTVTVTAGGTSNTKGAWTEVIAANSAETSVLDLYVSGISVSATDTSTLIDIATGASGSETAIVSNIAVGGAAGVQIVLPIRIPSSARISLRSQAVIASDTASVVAATYAIGDASTVPTTLDVLGTTTSDSRGTQVAISGTYTEIVASTSQQYDGIMLVPSQSDTYAIPTSFKEYALTGAVGASGSETDVCQQNYRAGLTEYVQTLPQQFSAVTGTTIAAGSRIAVKRNDPYNTMFVAVIGVPST